MDEDEELRLALEMSLLDAQQQADNGQPLSDEQLAIQLDKQMREEEAAARLSQLQRDEEMARILAAAEEPPRHPPHRARVEKNTDYEMRKALKAERNLVLDMENASMFKKLVEVRADLAARRIDLRDVDLGPLHVESLLTLLQTKRNSALEELLLTIATPLTELEFASIVSCIPRQCIRRLAIAAFVKPRMVNGEPVAASDCATALNLLIGEAPKLRHLDLVLESVVSKSLLSGLELWRLHSLKLTAGFSEESLRLLADSLRSEESSLSELSLFALSCVDDEYVCKGLCAVLDAVAKTVRSLTLGFFPGLNVSFESFASLCASIRSIQCLEVFGFMGRLRENNFTTHVNGILKQHCGNLREVVLCTKVPVNDMFSSIRFARLEKLVISANKLVCMKDVDSVVQSVVGCKAVLTHLVFSGLRNDEEEEELVSDAACKHIASFSKLQHLAILSLEEGKAQGMMKSVAKMPSLRHLGINLGNGELSLPPNCTSLELVMDRDGLDPVHLLSLPLHQLRRVGLFASSLQGRFEGDELLASLFENVREIAITTTIEGNFAEALFSNPVFFSRLRQIDLMEIPRGEQESELWLQLLPWQCKVSLQVNVLAQHLGLTLASGFSEVLLPLLASFGLVSDECRQDEAVEESFWIEMASGAVNGVPSKKAEAAIKAFRINREMKLCEMRACVFELGKIMLRFGVPKDIRRMITKLAFTTIIE